MSSPADSKAPASAFESPTFGEDSSFHVEQPVGSMSISPCGRDVVLASKEGLHVIDLDSPYSPPRYLPHHTPWEVADVQWSPFGHRDYWVVSTSNQKALVWNLAMKTWENSIEYVLHAHSRAITDINFSAHHADILATCAVDSFVHCWDLRIPARPVVSFSDWFAGATQVKWNRQDPHVIASSHDKYLRIWDDRMGAKPLKSIEAHNTKIYGIDWNRMRREAIVTCSLDKTIKIWNYDAECDTPEKMIETSFPVWRARNTPFGFGILAMPQRGDNDLHLYSRRRTDEHGPGEGPPLVHSFPGHKGQVKEFLWRPRGTVIDGLDHREFQLVSWGADRELRLHRVDPDLLRSVGYEQGKSFDFSLPLTRQGSVYKTFRDDPPDEELSDSIYAETVISSGTRPQVSAGIGTNNVSTRYSRAPHHGVHIEPRVGMQGRSQLRTNLNPIAWMRGVKISGWDIETLGDEITHVGEKFSKVDFESVDVRQRKVTISLHGPWAAEGTSLFLKLDIKFPSDYPRTAIPSFRIQKTAAMTDELSETITSELRTISETYLSRKRGCLEGALRYLLGECNLEESIALVLGETTDTIKSPVSGLEDDESSDEDEDVGQFEKEELGMSSESLRPINANVMVPVARVCGATWSQDGRLVCFFPSKKDKIGSLFDSLGFKDFGRFTRNDKVFEGFGRLQTSSPSRLTPGKALGTMSLTDDGGSDYSDDSDTDSSSSSGSSDNLSGLPNRFPAAPMWRSLGGLGSGTYRTKSADNSQLSTAGGPATTKSDPGHNIISIHDLSDLLPAKKSLASQYKIFGHGADICAHNAAVAADADHHHLAHVWGLLKLVLHNQSRHRDPTFNTDDFTLDKKEGGARVDIPRQKSGSKNILQQFGPSAGLQGGKWLINALIEHFERMGDVQMLAMLSCILHEQMLRHRAARRRDRDVSFNQTHSPFAVDFFSSKARDGKSQVATPLTSYSRDGSVNIPGLQSPDIAAEQLNSIATTPYSSGTSPMATSASKPLGDRRTPNLSISASPDNPNISRTGSGIGTALASSWSRSFTFGPSSGSSPPVNAAKKKPSPNGSLNVPSAVTWSATQIFNKAVSALPEYLNTSAVVTSSQTQSEADSEKKKGVRKLRVNVSLKNRAAFDPDESSSGPFIDRKQEGILRKYRNAYANLLFVWDLPIQRSEVLKIGTTADLANEGPTSRRRQPSQTLPLTVPKQKGSVFAKPTAGSTLDVQRHCSECGTALHTSLFSPASRKEPSGKISKQPYLRCPSCTAVQPLAAHIACVICGESIDGMFVPCLECGHVCCVECHRQWFSLSSPDEDIFTLSDLACPSPCGCSCTEHSKVVYLPSPIRTPQNEKAQPLNKHNRRRSEALSSPQLDIMAGQTDDDLEAWRGVTLGGGFGGGLSRVLTSTDRRRNSSGNRRLHFDRIDTM